MEGKLGFDMQAHEGQDGRWSGVVARVEAVLFSETGGWVVAEEALGADRSLSSCWLMLS